MTTAALIVGLVVLSVAVGGGVGPRHTRALGPGHGHLQAALGAGAGGRGGGEGGDRDAVQTGAFWQCSNLRLQFLFLLESFYKSCF